MQNLYSNFSDSENFYKKWLALFESHLPRIFKNIRQMSVAAKYLSHQLCDPLCRILKYLLTFFIASVKPTSRNLHHISQHLSRGFNLSIAVTFYSSVKSYPVFSVTDTNFCDLMCQWLTRHALKVLYSLLSSNTQNPYKSVLICIQFVFNIIAVLRTNRVLHEICIDIKVSVSDFLRGATKNYNHHLLTFTWKTVKQLDSHFEGILIVTNCIDSVIYSCI